MPTAVVLCKNIYIESGEKLFRGDTFEGSEDFLLSVLEGDELAEREPRLTIIKEMKPKKKEASTNEAG